MSNVLNLTSKRAEVQAVKLATALRKECGGEDMVIVACALMAVVRTLPSDLQAQICGAVTVALTQELNPSGNDDPKSNAS
jgi:hypothetical protein